MYKLTAFSLSYMQTPEYTIAAYKYGSFEKVTCTLNFYSFLVLLKLYHTVRVVGDIKMEIIVTFVP